jgi:hypothetical protein
MRTLLLTFLLVGAVITRGDDDSNSALKNGDFSSGVNHWEGDCHTPDSSTFSDSEEAPTSGVVVKLRGSWTQVWQEFNSKVGEYQVSITYAAASDLKLSSSVPDYENISGQLGFNGLKPFSAPTGDWVVLINDRASMLGTYWKIKPKLDASGPQTINLKIHIGSGDDAVKGFFLLFPPGNGYINLLNVSLTPAGPANP